MERSQTEKEVPQDSDRCALEKSLHVVPRLTCQRCYLLPGYLSSRPFQAVGVADEFVQHVDNLAELWPFSTLFLPTIQHQLVQRDRTVHGRRKPIAFLDRLDHLTPGEIQTGS